MSKESTAKALNRFFEKDAKKLDKEMNGGVRRKNERPEFELTKKPCMKWMTEHRFSMDSIEAKAVYNYDAGRYTAGQTVPGVADAFGCTPYGHAAFVEFKAPGCRSGLKDHQREWLTTKIRLGCFAVCVDTVSCLSEAWFYWSTIERERGIQYLLEHLPKKRLKEEKINDDGMPQF